MKSAIRNAYIFVTLNALFWGLTSVFGKMVLEVMSVPQFVFYRMLIATVIAIPYLLYIFGLGKSLKSFLRVRNILVMLFSFGITTFLSFEALSYTTVILFTFVGALRPLIADMLGAYILREKIEKSEIIGTLIAFTGTILMIFFQSLNQEISVLGNSALTNNIIGVSLAFLSSILWIISNILHKGVDKTEKRIVSHTGLVLTFLISIIFVAFNNPKDFEIPSMSLELWLALIFTGTFGASFAMVSFQKAIETIEVSEANLFYYLQVAITIPAAMIILGEEFNLWMLLPLALIIFGVWLNIRTKFKKKVDRKVRNNSIK